jgi:hypothetical protein
VELHNPHTERVLAKIKFNGKYIDSAGVVLRPGERIYLERYIDRDQAFVFSTYDVEDTLENRKAISYNGDVEVEFYAEDSGTTTGWVYNPAFTINATNNQWHTEERTYWYGHNTNFVPPVAGTTVSYTTELNTSNHVAGSFETGQVERGSTTGQNLKNTVGTFYSYPFQTSRIKILPHSAKPAEASEIRKYCTECGTRMKKSSWKFCPHCGTKI